MFQSETYESEVVIPAVTNNGYTYGGKSEKYSCQDISISISVILLLKSVWTNISQTVKFGKLRSQFS